MGSKVIALFTIVASGAFFYYCIDVKKEKIAALCNKSDTIETKAQPLAAREESEKSLELPRIVSSEKSEENLSEIEPSVKEIEKSDPAFGVAFGNKINIVGMFAPDAKDKVLIQFIDELCSTQECINDIRFSKDIKSVAWYPSMVSLIQMFYEEQIAKGSLYINSNVLHIEGEIETEDQKKHLEKLIDTLKKDGLFVEDETISMITKVPETEVAAVPSETTEEVSVQEKSSEESSTETKMRKNQNGIDSNNTLEKSEEKKIQEVSIHKEIAIVEETTEENDVSKEDTIDTILREKPIYFDAKVKHLDEESRKTLDLIAEKLKKYPDAKIEILGYDNSGDSAILQIVVSQKKADIVRNYLFKKGLRNLISKGLGAGKKEIQIQINIIKE